MDAAILGGGTGLGVVAVGILALGGTWIGVRKWLRAVNTDAWAREWTLVEPEWTGPGR